MHTHQHQTHAYLPLAQTQHLCILLKAQFNSLTKPRVKLSARFDVLDAIRVHILTALHRPQQERGAALLLIAWCSRHLDLSP